MVARLTYADMAAWYDTTLADLDWPEKRVTHGGLRRFLSRIRHVQWRDRFAAPEEEWRRLWKNNVWASQEALTVWHKRIPKKLADHDRARVAAILARRHGPLTADEKAALKWANQREL